MSPVDPLHRVRRDRFPRVSGDEPADTFKSVGMVLFSPRERG